MKKPYCNNFIHVIDSESKSVSQSYPSLLLFYKNRAYDLVDEETAFLAERLGYLKVVMITSEYAARYSPLKLKVNIYVRLSRNTLVCPLRELGEFNNSFKPVVDFDSTFYRKGVNFYLSCSQNNSGSVPAPLKQIEIRFRDRTEYIRTEREAFMYAGKGLLYIEKVRRYYDNCEQVGSDIYYSGAYKYNPCFYQCDDGLTDFYFAW